MKSSANHLLPAYSLLIVPVFDVFRIIIYRFRNRRPLFDADKSHIHHKLMGAGLTQHQTLLVIIALALGFVILNTLISESMGITGVVALDAALFTLFHWLLAGYVRKSKKRS